eukprot:TRINITY_DN13434_c0_g1_i3.p2 TRINITY_DN13434_c0_g1~~TRINITY_DN13434_c0_g1_i3.p2  ORF type:complete len:182 (+),score=24.84 TRINITY_DN13434_c0_g1_i3:43-588(+)
MSSFNFFAVVWASRTFATFGVHDSNARRPALMRKNIRQSVTEISSSGSLDIDLSRESREPLVGEMPTCEGLDAQQQGQWCQQLSMDSCEDYYVTWDGGDQAGPCKWTSNGCKRIGRCIVAQPTCEGLDAQQQGQWCGQLSMASCEDHYVTWTGNNGVDKAARPVVSTAVHGQLRGLLRDLD